MSSSALDNEPQRTTRTPTTPSPGLSKMGLKVFGLYGAVMSLANVLGPVMGGLLTEADLFGLSWRPIFLVNVPVGLAVLLLGRRFIPESTVKKADRPDLTGMALSALAIVLIVFPLSEGHLHHWPLWCFALLAAGLLVLGVFLRHQKRKQDNAPLVALSLFQGRQFPGGMAAQLMHGLLCGLFFMTWTLYLRSAAGLPPAASCSTQSRTKRRSAAKSPGSVCACLSLSGTAIRPSGNWV